MEQHYRTLNYRFFDVRLHAEWIYVVTRVVAFHLEWITGIDT